MDLGLRSKRALVLGSTAGLGLAVARSLAAEGARVVVHGRDEERARQGVLDGHAEAYVIGDLSADGESERVVDEAVAALGGLDICVVNTGGGRAGHLMLGDAGDDEAAWRSMLRPALNVSRRAAGPLTESGDGRLVFMTARSILEATPELARSSVMRSGVRAAAYSLARELAPHVLVNVVATGQFDTGALRRFEAARAADEDRTPEEVRAHHVADIPLGRLGLPEELADVVTFLCSARAGFVTGSTVRVDGGSVTGF